MVEVSVRLFEQGPVNSGPRVWFRHPVYWVRSLGLCQPRLLWQELYAWSMEPPFSLWPNPGSADAMQSETREPVFPKMEIAGVHKPAAQILLVPPVRLRIRFERQLDST